MGSNFQFASGSGGTVKITDPAGSLQAGFITAAAPAANQFADVGQFGQYVAGQFASAAHDNAGLATGSASSGSSAFLAQGHG
jgi:hypothetical protein